MSSPSRLPVNLAKTRFRQSNGNDRAFARLALDLDPAVMQFDQSLCQRQAKTYSAAFPIESGIDLPERLQCYRYLVDRHSDAGVLDPKRHAPIGISLHLESNPAARLCELDRIGQEIDEDLCEFVGIANYLRQMLFDLTREIDPCPARHILNHLRAAIHDFANLHLLLGQQQFVGIYFG